MLQIDELIEKVEVWARVRDLDTADPEVQTLKVIKGFTEMIMSVRHSDIVSSIGDVYVALIILCRQFGIPTLPQAPLIELSVRITSGHSRNDQVALMAINMLVTSILEGERNKVQSSVIAIKTIADLSADEVGATPYECLEVAYEEIKDREGAMDDGASVKYDDHSAENIKVVGSVYEGVNEN